MVVCGLGLTSCSKDEDDYEQQCQEFLDKNAKRAEVTVTSSGLQYEVLEEGNGKIVGEKHIKMRVCYRDRNCRPIDGIAFNQKENFDKITSGKEFDLLYHVEENTWNNVTSIQLNVKDIKASVQEI